MHVVGQGPVRIGEHRHDVLELIDAFAHVIGHAGGAHAADELARLVEDGLLVPSRERVERPAERTVELLQVLLGEGEADPERHQLEPVPPPGLFFSRSTTISWSAPLELTISWI